MGKVLVILLGLATLLVIGAMVYLVRIDQVGDAVQAGATLTGLFGAGYIARWQTNKSLESVADQMQSQTRLTEAQIQAAAELAIKSRQYEDALKTGVEVLDGVGAALDKLMSMGIELTHAVEENPESVRDGSWYDERKWNADTESIRQLSARAKMVYDRWTLIGEPALSISAKDVHDEIWNAVSRYLADIFELTGEPWTQKTVDELLEELMVRQQQAAGTLGGTRAQMLTDLTRVFEGHRSTLDELRRQAPNS